ncbi:MAG: hypothetical protein ACOYXW_01610 [Actinomycetota bacterium]
MELAVFFAVVAAMVVLCLLPTGRRRSRLRLGTASLLERGARWLRHGEPPPDPFEALRLQLRLGVVADQVRALEESPHVYAKAHRLRATRAAYDDLLEEACLLAGVPLDPQRRRGERERRREEVELASRGWSW